MASLSSNPTTVSSPRTSFSSLVRPVLGGTARSLPHPAPALQGSELRSRLRACRAAEESAQGTGTAQGKSASPSADGKWDLDWFHYTPWWYKPHYVIIAGLSFIVGCNLGTGNPCLKTTMLAAAPVLFMWFIFLHMIPSQFKDYARDYIATHPECEKAAAARACQQQATAQQQQQRQPQA